MHHKPEQLRFIGCQYLPDRQGKPLQATYQVSGRSAASTEAYLGKAVGLGQLERYCCEWEAHAHQFKDASGRAFSIAMGSGETMATTRAAWPSIPLFTVTVEIFTEDI